MSHHTLATEALAEWALQHLAEREQAARSEQGINPGILSEPLYVAVASSLALLCSLCRPTTRPGALDADLSELCGMFRTVLDAAAAAGAPNTMLITQLEPGMSAAPEVREAAQAYVALTLLAALEARPLCITLCLCRVNHDLSLEIVADTVAETDTALQYLAQADVIAREAGADVFTDDWQLPLSRQICFPLVGRIAEAAREADNA